MTGVLYSSLQLQWSRGGDVLGTFKCQHACYVMLMLSVKHKRTHMQCHAVGMVDVPMGDDRDMQPLYIHSYMLTCVVLTHMYIRYSIVQIIFNYLLFHLTSNLPLLKDTPNEGYHRKYLSTKDTF